LISLSQPSNPLNGEDLPIIDVAIPCAAKDFATLPFVIQGVKKNVANPIGNIQLITPSGFVPELKAKFPDCAVLSDEMLLDKRIVDEIESHSTFGRKNWIRQQIIKIKIGLASEAGATLILDADTILLKRKVWLDSKGVQILCISEEFNPVYKTHQMRFYNHSSLLLSFVTHHQLMLKERLSEIFGPEGQGLVEWIKNANVEEASSISEYDTYGEFMVRNRRKEIVFSKWNNLPQRITEEISKLNFEELSKRFGDFCSLSNHSYLK